MDKSIVTAFLNPAKSKYSIHLETPAGEACSKHAVWKQPGTGDQGHCSRADPVAQPLLLFSPTVPKEWQENFGSTASLSGLWCALKPAANLPALPHGSRRELVWHSPLSAPSADTAPLFLPSAYLQKHTHTHKGQTQRKAIYIPGMFISMKHWWELVSAALPIALCISVWEAPKAEMTLMRCSVISLLPNNLN